MNTCKKKKKRKRKKKKKRWFIIYWTQSTIVQSLNLIGLEQHFQLKLIDIAVTLKYNQDHRKRVNGLSSASTTTMQSLTFTMFIVSEEFATLKVLPHTDIRPAVRRNIDHYILSIFHVSQKTQICVTKDNWLKKETTTTKKDPD